MKKFLIFIFILAAVLTGFIYWPKIKSLLIRQPQLAQVIQNNFSFENIKQQVFTGGALRGAADNPGAFLTRSGTINFTNEARQKNGNLPALKENLLLNKAAQAKLQDMFKQQYFEHVSPQGKGPSDLAVNAGYQYVIIGENLALGNFKNDSALVDAWMQSPGHRANILQPKYLEIGVAVGQGVFEGKRVWIAVQEFGRPLSACPQVDLNLKSQIDSLKDDVQTAVIQLEALKSQINADFEPKSQAEADAYNQKVSEYNNLVKIYNNKVDLLRQYTNDYNLQVQNFNLCAG